MDMNTGVAIVGGMIIVGGVIYFLTRKPAGAVPEPPCIEGEQRCDGTDLLECQNGEWVVIKTNAPECGYVPPICTEGERWCDGYNLMECQNGKWVKIEHNSPECGYVPPDKIYTIEGQVVDRDTKDPVSAADVCIWEKNMCTITNSQGVFIINNIPVSYYEALELTLVLNHPDYETNDYLVSLPEEERVVNITIEAIAKPPPVPEAEVEILCLAFDVWNNYRAADENGIIHFVPDISFAESMVSNAWGQRIIALLQNRTGKPVSVLCEAEVTHPDGTTSHHEWERTIDYSIVSSGGSGSPVRGCPDIVIPPGEPAWRTSPIYPAINLGFFKRLQAGHYIIDVKISSFSQLLDEKVFEYDI